MHISFSSDHRHDLEALRALAMLLIIFFHGALSFFDAPWPIQDAQRNEGIAVIFLVIHGFQMPLFFAMSGFFTAMLWRTRGVKVLLKHRFRRVFLPLVVGLVTVSPLTGWINEALVEATLQRARESTPSPLEDAGMNIWIAAKDGDLKALKAHLDKVDLNAQDRQAGLTPLSWAVLAGKVAIVEQLIKVGADVNAKNKDGGTPLHEAAFMGWDEIAELLLQNGADVDARDDNGETPLNRAQIDWKRTYLRVSELQVKFDPVEALYGRTGVAATFSQYGSWGKILALTKPNNLWRTLTTKRVFQHLWLFWFLCWLVLAFALYAAIVDRIQWLGPPARIILSPLRYLWLIPLTMVPQWFMAGRGAIPNFGPDNALCILPMPYLPIYYGTFFFFGAFYYDCDDSAGKLGKQWIITLPVALLIIFPVAVTLGLSPDLLKKYHLVSVALKAVYAWMMVFSLMGISRELIARDSRLWRYISDAAYWVYLGHLPLILVAQEMVRTWDLPAILKFGLICCGVTGVLLLIHQFFLRYTFVGTLLNRHQ